ncbi:hypothetical protein KSZ_13070 [Dictyobacter formicarum]|uniref:Uncharacterized protein n=2 Tax=Dictyobacter formicarum TaxID=2778368 RepID=A0ABQ3VC58_9CHLR|nr:hypothetical protein KSZ_13070 [Dictyobacter formicarum]
MGTDIFLYAEWRHNEPWQFIGEMSENIVYQYDPEHENPYHPKDLYNVRNYNLFAILADVRNDVGYECIAPRRGIPNDLSPEIKSYFEVFQSEEMGRELYPGWLTLEELVHFDWHGKRIQRYGRVDERVAHLFHSDRGFPFREWPQGIQIGYSRMPKASKYCNACWTETYAESAGPDFMELLDTFSRKYGVSKDIRLVFWFA